jgi:drug/metabolite transporter (DMT)-like permease
MPNPMRSRTAAGAHGSLPVLALLLTGVLWSSGGFLIKLVSWNPVAIAGARSLIAAALIAVVGGIPKLTWSRSQVAAGVFYAATMILFVTANKLTTSANAILLQSSSPVFVAIFASLLLGEKTRKSDWLVIAAVMAGMVLFFMDELTLSGMWGNLVAVGSGVTLALYLVFMRMQKDGSPIGSVFLAHIMTAVVAIPFAFSNGMPTATGWLGILLLGVFQNGISSILLAYGVKHVTAVSTVLISLIEPVLNPVWVFLLLGEAPSRNAAIGGLIILAVVTVRSVLVAVGAGGAAPETEAAASEPERS